MALADLRDKLVAVAAQHQMMVDAAFQTKNDVAALVAEIDAELARVPSAAEVVASVKALLEKLT